jgi:membrane protease YdiL (CAAX protease family)
MQAPKDYQLSSKFQSFILPFKSGVQAKSYILTVSVIVLSILVVKGRHVRYKKVKESQEKGNAFPPLTTLSSTDIAHILFSSSIQAPLIEELVFRYLLFRNLLWKASSLSIATSTMFWASFLLTNVIFGLSHQQYDLFGKGSTFIVGSCITHAYVVTGSLWSSILLHSLTNFKVSFICYTHIKYI